MEATTRSRPREDTLGRVVLLLLAVVYLVLGIGGFAEVGWNEFRFEEPIRLFGIVGVSTLGNIVHTLVGVIALAAGTLRASAAFVPVLGVVFTAMTAFGLVARIFADQGDPMNMTWWNVVLYAASALACLLVDLTRRRRVRPRA